MRARIWRGKWLMGVLVLAMVSGRVAGQTMPVGVRVAVSSEPVVRGSTTRIGVEVKIDPRYHIQSATPLDANIIATVVKVKGGTGISAGLVKYPVDEKIPAPAGTTKEKFLAVYSGTVYVIVPVTVAEDAPLGPQTMTVSVRSQACDDKKCFLPKTQTAEVVVTVAAAGTAVKENEAELFAAADKQVFAEKPASTGPATQAAPETQEAGASAVGKGLLSEEEQLRLIEARPYRPFNAQENQYPLYLIILLALAGGAILNVMPCVLPVIPLKVLSLVQQAHGDRRVAVLHGLVFSAGVVMLFMALAIVLQTFGLFYGQQFQSVGFLIALVMFVVALAMSMLGVWTLNPPQALYSAEAKAPHTGYLGSFANGLMATLLATPCSAPFLGGVLAWALVQKMWVAALTLGLVGVGMSLPYLVLAMFPGLLGKVPRAGRWSELLKQFLGIVMIGVAVYLITLIPNVTYWSWVLMGAVVVAVVCWAWGQIPTYNMAMGRVWGIGGVALAVGGVLGVGLWVMASGMTAKESAVVVNDGEWQAFNVGTLDQALKEGKPVVVDWTASWCINCRVLEAVVLKTEGVERAFRERGAVLLKADLTRDNPPASMLNRKLGGEAIPVLAIFSPERPLEPVVLRDSYTEERVKEELSH